MNLSLICTLLITLEQKLPLFHFYKRLFRKILKIRGFFFQNFKKFCFKEIDFRYQGLIPFRQSFQSYFFHIFKQLTDDFIIDRGYEFATNFQVLHYYSYINNVEILICFFHLIELQHRIIGNYNNFLLKRQLELDIALTCSVNIDHKKIRRDCFHQDKLYENHHFPHHLFHQIGHLSLEYSRSSLFAGLF